MDWLQVIPLAAAILGIVPPGVEIYKIVRDRLKKINDRKIQDALTQFETLGDQESFISSLQESATSNKDTGADFLGILDDVQNKLMDCLLERFTDRDLREVYVRLGISYDELVTGTLASKADKANALIIHLRADNRLPDLIAVMWKVRPGVSC